MDAQTQHQLDSVSLLILSFLLILTVLTVWRFKIHTYRILHETGVSMLIGIVAGLFIRLRQRDEYHPTELVCNATAREDYLRNNSGAIIEAASVFNPEIFFYVLLPPIIFSAGFTLQSKSFFENIGGILAFAFLGTTISCFVVGLLMYMYTAVIDPMDWPLLDALAFGALISATDPVTVLAIFREMRVELDLYILVFGESVLNDAVSIVLYTSIEALSMNQASTLTAASVFHSIWVFLLIFSGSVSCGILVGILNSLTTKFSFLKKHEVLESAFFVVLSYSSFLLAESFGLSGIVSILFCGLTQTHYTFQNLSKGSQTKVTSFFEIMNFLAENFIFSYIGLSLFTYRCHVFHAGFIAWSIGAIVVARAVHVFPISYCLNRYRRHGDNKITRSYQMVLLWAGLRGAIAFALSIRTAVTETQRMVLTTTMSIVYITILFLGGGTAPLIRSLKLKTGVPERQEDDLDGVPHTVTGRVARLWHRLDHVYLRPVITTVPHGPSTGTDTLPALKSSIMAFFFPDSVSPTMEPLAPESSSSLELHTILEADVEA